jgi:hypothetical protein
MYATPSLYFTQLTVLLVVPQRPPPDEPQGVVANLGGGHLAQLPLEGLLLVALLASTVPQPPPTVGM